MNLQRPGTSLLVRARLVAVATLFVIVPACGPKRMTTYPVRGEVYVDGQPAAELQVYFHPIEGEAAGGRVLYGMTNDQGVYTINTYVAGDGVPAGEYIVTFEWNEKGKGLQQANYTGPDRLKHAYSDEKKSKYRVKVEKQSTKIPRYELTRPK